MSYLYKATTARRDPWRRDEKTPPAYVVAENLPHATQLLESHLRDDLKITRLVRLAEQVSGCMFVGA